MWKDEKEISFDMVDLNAGYEPGGTFYYTNIVHIKQMSCVCCTVDHRIDMHSKILKKEMNQITFHLMVLYLIDFQSQPA